LDTSSEKIAKSNIFNNMKKQSQKKVWDKIAPEWHEFKQSPSEAATEFINNSKGRILDFGSGSGRNLLKLKKSTIRKLYLVDFSEKMINLAEKRAKELGIKIITKISKLEKTDFPDNYFDAAICISALHCIKGKENREKAVHELFRVLKPKAQALIGVWNKDSNRFIKKPKEKFIKWRNKGKRYYYLFDEKEFKNFLEKTGFKIIKKIPHRANLIFIIEKPISS